MLTFWENLERGGLTLLIFIGPRSPGPIYVSGCHWVSEWVTERPCWNLTDVTLADKETNLILTDKVNRVIQGNVAMKVTQPGGQLWNLGKWCHLITKFLNQFKWRNDQILNQFASPAGDQIWNWCKWRHLVTKSGTNSSGSTGDNSSSDTEINLELF